MAKFLWEPNFGSKFILLSSTRGFIETGLEMKRPFASNISTDSSDIYFDSCEGNSVLI